MTKPTLTTTVISDLAWEQLTNMDAPANSPIASTVAGVAPVQSWEETDQVLPDIGQVDNELLAAAGLSNTILISVKTEEVLKTITVSIGANGNWFVGGVDTGVPAKGTDEATIARPTGVYGAASVFHVGNTITIGAGLMYCVKEGSNFYTMQTAAELNISVDASTTFVTIDRTGTVRTYSSGINLWTIPESQALVALVIDTDGTVSSFAVPTVHNAMLMASAVIPYSRGAIEAASTATLQATIASQFAGQAHQSALDAEAAKVVTQADAVITTTNAQQTEQWKNDAQSAATSAHQFADFADADRVATAADRAQVAADKATVATDKGIVATDKGIVASDKAIVLGYKNDAAASKNLAAEYAIKPENSIITGTVSDYSALHWAQKAQQWAQVSSSTLVWKGQWSATGNVAPPTPVAGSGAHFYRISGAGVIYGTYYAVGDYIHWDSIGKVWFKIDGTDAVTSVNGKSGAVILNSADVGAQPADATLTAIATQMTAADRLPYFTGTDTAALTVFTAFARTLLDDASLTDTQKTLQLPTAGGFGFRNKIINGDFRITQRGESGTIAAGQTVLTADRWIVETYGSSVAWGVDSYTTGYPDFYLIGASGNTSIGLSQRIEAANCTNLPGNKVTISFRLYGNSAAGSEGVEVTPYLYAAGSTDNFSAPTFVEAFPAVNVIDGIKSVVATSAVLPASVAKGLQLQFEIRGLDAASKPVAFLDVQLEIGEVATPFEHRPYQTEMALCQRYFVNKRTTYAGAMPVNNGVFAFVCEHPVSMRTTPTLMWTEGYNAGGASFVETSNLSVHSSRILYRNVSGAAAGGVDIDGSLMCTAEL